VISVALKTPLEIRLGICIYKTSLLHRSDDYIGFTQARSQVLSFRGAKCIFRGHDFCFYYIFKTNFSGNTKIWGAQKKFGGHCPECSPVATDLVSKQAAPTFLQQNCAHSHNALQNRCLHKNTLVGAKHFNNDRIVASCTHHNTRDPVV